MSEEQDGTAVETDQGTDQGTDESTDETEVQTDEDGNQLAPDGSTVEEVEAEREERLDPENRPDGAEVDNTDRTFDEKTGFFTDSDGADGADEVYKAASDEA